jgi:glycosyltransferase involved in cell wall biosynthesis
MFNNIDGYSALLLNFRDVDFEVIVVDDGSPDGTQDVVQQLQQVYGEDRIVSTRIYNFNFHI